MICFLTPTYSEVHSQGFLCELLGSIILSASLVLGIVAALAIILVIHNYSKFKRFELRVLRPLALVQSCRGREISHGKKDGDTGMVSTEGKKGSPQEREPSWSWYRGVPYS